MERTDPDGRRINTKKRANRFVFGILSEVLADWGVEDD